MQHTYNIEFVSIFNRSSSQGCDHGFAPDQREYGATEARLIPDQKVWSLNLSGLIFATRAELTTTASTCRRGGGSVASILWVNDPPPSILFFCEARGFFRRYFPKGG